ncbi:DegV family protein [Furfurilactobacillus siliginis]|uniref:EDD domain protein, DegV family n=1 Tax=Furfurilactobacillus siliginis TaxID=348151 RepID=A0A0R2L3B2_9LACO|nr:DegV family protein [Furfurilactobacillus siliginis]KRN93980.1 EDD domain protein, DegV family [Furfurilactobacillus siliginis]GEK29228.1 hypothetical protein LSI01_15390 [Furfurilactobacillus siliginis]
MSEKIALLVDSASDVPGSVFAEHDNIAVVPLQIVIDGETLVDRETIDPATFYQRQATAKQLPKTASPSLGDVIEKVDLLKQHGFTHIVGITISAALSVTNGVFQQVADMQSDVIMSVINTKNIGVGSGLFAQYAESLIDSGQTFINVVTKLMAAVSQSSVYFYIPTLKYLRAGGRIGKVTGFVGAALNIKPVITCDSDGVYTTVAKARTEKKAIEKMIALASRDVAGHAHARVAVGHSANPDLMKQIVMGLKGNFPGLQIEIGDISPAIGVHTGPGVVGIAVQAG